MIFFPYMSSYVQEEIIALYLSLFSFVLILFIYLSALF
jgi:hypothetical protein